MDYIIKAIQSGDSVNLWTETKVHHHHGIKKIYIKWLKDRRSFVQRYAAAANGPLYRARSKIEVLIAERIKISRIQPACWNGWNKRTGTRTRKKTERFSLANNRILLLLFASQRMESDVYPLRRTSLNKLTGLQYGRPFSLSFVGLFVLASFEETHYDLFFVRRENARIYARVRRARTALYYTYGLHILELIK